MLEKRDFTINALKADGTIKQSWQAVLIDETSELMRFAGVFQEEIVHRRLGVIRRGTVSYEFYWKNRWYNIFRFHEPESGALRNFYCNINQPPKINDNVLNYVDLDIDVLVWNDWSFEILDRAEFEQNAKRYTYSKNVRRKVFETLEEIIKLINARRFPFDYESRKK